MVNPTKQSNSKNYSKSIDYKNIITNKIYNQILESLNILNVKSAESEGIGDYVPR